MKVIDVLDSNFSKDDIVDFLRSVSDDFIPSLDTRIVQKSTVRSFSGYVDKLFAYGKISICEIEGNIVGLLAYYCNNECAKVSYIPLLAVKREHSRKGIATLLLHDSVRRVQRLGFHTIRIETSPTNTAALTLYMRNGFVVEEDNGSVVKLVKSITCR